MIVAIACALAPLASLAVTSVEFEPACIPAGACTRLVQTSPAQGARQPHGPGRRVAHAPWNGPSNLADVPYPPFTSRNVFDWYAPPFEIPGGNPVLLWVHGGGFDEDGNEALVLTDAPFAELRSRGYAIVSVRWRQRTSGVFGADMVRDPGYVVQRLRAEASAWHIDPDAIVGCGNSSGAFALSLLAFGPDLAAPNAADPVLRESSRIDAFFNDRAETDWLHFIDGAITNHPFSASDLAGATPSEKELASALWWLQQPNAPSVPTISFYRSSVHPPPLVNLHDGWLGQELHNALVALGEQHCSFTVVGTSPIPWDAVYDWFFDVVGV